MKTLVSNASDNCMKQGIAPRLFVKIAGANLYLGTKAYTETAGDLDTYLNSLKKSGVISQSIKPTGGMGEVSGVDIANLELGNDVTFCTEEDIDPKKLIAEPVGCGRLMKTGDEAESYANVRGSITASFSTPQIVIGQRYISGDVAYIIYRGVFHFDIPAGITSCEDATLCIFGNVDKSDTDFQLYLIKGMWSDGEWGYSQTFNDFTGWETGATAYDGTEATGSPALNHEWKSQSFTTSLTTPNYIRLNNLAKEYIVAEAGSEVKFMLVSSLDFAGTPPTGDEYQIFHVHNAYLKLRYNTYNLYNQEAIIYLDFANTTGVISETQVSEMQRIWTGVIDDFSINESTLNLKLKQNNFKKNILIPKTIIDSTTFTNCPETNIGKPYPIVYGDFLTALSSLTHENGIGYANGDVLSAIGTYIYGYTRNFLKAMIVKDTKSMKALLSEMVMKECDNPFYFWNSSRKKWEIYPIDPSTDTPSDTEVIITLDSVYNFGTAGFPDILINNQYYGIAQATIPFRHELYLTPANPEYSYNSSPNTYATFTNINETIYYYFEDAPGTSINRYLCASGQIAYEGGALDESFQLIVQYSDDDGSTWKNIAGGVSPSYNIPEGTDGQFHYRFTSTVALTFNLTSLSQLRFYIFRRDMVTDLGECRLANVALYTGYSSGEVTELATEGKGVYFGSWIDAVVRSNTQNENDLIENPSFVIESIARDCMGLVTANIDYAQFDATFTNLVNWDFAFQILDRIDSENLIDKLGMQSRCFIFWDESDKMTILDFDKDRDFPNADADTPDLPGDLDIFDSDATVTSGAFTTHPILSPQFSEGSVDEFEMWKMGMDETKNDFVLHYYKNHNSGEYEKTLYITNGSGTEGSVSTNITVASLENSQDLTSSENLKELTSDSYTELQTTNTWEYKADYIRDDATANKLLQHYVERLTRNRWYIRFSTSINAIAVEMGDFINIRHERIYDIFGTPTTLVKKWMVYRLEANLSSFNITIEAIET